MTGGGSPLSIGDGTLLTLYFEIIGEASESSPLNLTDNCMIGDSSGDPIPGVIYSGGSITIECITGTDDIQSIPSAFKLHQCYPNPFNPITNIGFEIPNLSGKRTLVNLAIYNAKGRLIKSLINNYYEPGVYSVMWDGLNNSGTNVASGIYFCKFTTGSFVETKKMILLR